MGGLIAIDPGEQTGWAIFKAGGELHSCGLFTSALDLYAKVGLVSKAIIEIPQIYPKDPVPPNDLIKLALTAGGYKLELERHGVRVETVKPREWKGQVPKAIHHKRIAAALRTDETMVVQHKLSCIAKSYQHNVWDAIGLGMWWLKKNGLR